MRKGFTLIELLITLLVFGILLLVPLSGFKALARASDLRSSAAMLEGSLFLAKQTAWGSGNLVEVGCAGNNVLIRTQDLLTGGFKTMRDIKLPGGSNISGTSVFRFSSSGNPVPGYIGTAIVSGGGKKTVKVVLSSAGRIRTE